MTRQFLRHHPVIGHLFIPDLRVRVEHEGGGYLMRVNGLGFRSDHEFEWRKKPGTFRILLFGDSFTAGDGVSNGSRYGDVLEQLIPGVEVYNLGMPGTGTDQQYLIFRDTVAEFEYDLLAIGVWVENIRRVAARHMMWSTAENEAQIFAKPYFSLTPDGGIELGGVPVPSDPVAPETLTDADEATMIGEYVPEKGPRMWLREMIYRMGPSVSDIARRITNSHPLPAYRSTDHPDWRLMKGILAQWIGEAQAPVVICPIPLHLHTEGRASPSDYQSRLGELADPPRTFIHDPLPDFRRYSRAERRAFRFPVDFHFTVAGHRAMAESLAPIVRSHMGVA